MAKYSLLKSACGTFAGLLALSAAPVGAQAPTLSILHTFTSQDSLGGNSDGAGPCHPIVQGYDGNYYGVTNGGGIVGFQTGGNGVIYKLTPGGVMTTLHYFSNNANQTQSNADGAFPMGIIQGQDGNLYGSCWSGGLNGQGTVWKMTTAGVFTTLYSFTHTTYNGSYATNTDGSGPGAISQAVDGNFYGGTGYAGANGTGTIFKVTPAGVLTVLHNFALYNTVTGTNTDGSGSSNPVQGLDGWLYGYTDLGPHGTGTIYKINSSGTFSTVHAFQAFTTTAGNSPNPDGAHPSSLFLGLSGTVYGTTSDGGNNGYGSGNGTFFSILSTGTFTTLTNFGQYTGAVGSNPTYAFYGTDGNFYGTAPYGGPGSGGEVFKLTTAGTYSTVYSFYNSQPNNGVGPFTIVGGSDGYLYGNNFWDGANNTGTIFRLATNLPRFPSITTFSPTSVTAGHATFTLTVSGQNFLPSSRVYFNSTALTTMYYTPTKITATVPASLVATAGNINLTVKSPSPAGTSPTSIFTVN